MSEALIADLTRQLENARARGEREGSDRHNNPGRARREFLAAMEARTEAHKLERVIDRAQHLSALDVSWTVEQGSLMLLLPDGKTFPAAEGEKLDEQLAIIRNAQGAGLGSTHHDRLTLHALNVSLARDLRWVRLRMPGVSAPKLRAGFLTNAGQIADGELTALGHECGLFTEHEGHFGIYQMATPLGVAWLYSCYLRGKLPMAKAAAKSPPVPNIELAAISKAAGDPGDALPQDLKDLAGW
jgi:hypothetical protein